WRARCPFNDVADDLFGDRCRQKCPAGITRGDGFENVHDRSPQNPRRAWPDQPPMPSRSRRYLRARMRATFSIDRPPKYAVSTIKAHCATSPDNASVVPRPKTLSQTTAFQT